MKGAREVDLAGTTYRVVPSETGADHFDVTSGWLALFGDPAIDEIHLWDVYDGGRQPVMEVWLSIELERGEGFVASGTLEETLTLRTPEGDPVLEVAEVSSGGLLGWPTYGVWDHGADAPLATWHRDRPALWNWKLRDGATDRVDALVSYEAKATAVKEALALGWEERTSYTVTTPNGGAVAALEKRGGTVVHGEFMREMHVSIEGGAIPPEILVAVSVGLLRGATLDAD